MEKQLSDFSIIKDEMQEAGRSIMQDQQSEGHQERRLDTGNVPIDVAPSHKPTTISPSSFQYERKRDYAYYKGIFGDRPMPFAFLDLDLLEQNIR